MHGITALRCFDLPRARPRLPCRSHAPSLQPASAARSAAARPRSPSASQLATSARARDESARTGSRDTLWKAPPTAPRSVADMTNARGDEPGTDREKFQTFVIAAHGDVPLEGVWQAPRRQRIAGRDGDFKHRIGVHGVVPEGVQDEHLHRDRNARSRTRVIPAACEMADEERSTCRPRSGRTSCGVTAPGPLHVGKGTYDRAAARFATRQPRIVRSLRPTGSNGAMCD